MNRNKWFRSQAAELIDIVATDIKYLWNWMAERMNVKGMHYDYYLGISYVIVGYPRNIN